MLCSPRSLWMCTTHDVVLPYVPSAGISPTFIYSQEAMLHTSHTLGWEITFFKWLFVLDGMAFFGALFTPNQIVCLDIEESSTAHKIQFIFYTVSLRCHFMTCALRLRKFLFTPDQILCLDIKVEQKLKFIVYYIPLRYQFKTYAPKLWK